MSDFISAFADRVSAETPFTVHKGRFQPRDAQGVSDYSPDDFPFIVVRMGLDEEFSGGGRDAPALDDVVDAVEVPLMVTYSGMSFDSVRVLQNATRAAMNRASLVVAGWHCGRLRQSPRLAPTEDDDVTVNYSHPWFAVDEYRLIATRET